MANNHITRHTFIIYNVSRFLLASVLMLSGISKLFYLQGFATEVAQYSELYISTIFVPFARTIAVAVCCTETALGISLLIPKLSAFAGIAVFVLMTFFLYLTAVNYLYPTILGSIESCGCFGNLMHFTAKGSFIKSVVLWTATLIMIILYRKSNRPYCIKGEYSEKRSE